MSKALCTLMIAMAAVSSISCSKDDDNDSGSLAETIWQYVYVKTGTSLFYLQLEFTSETDATMKVVMSANDIITDVTQPADFTYEYDGKNGLLDWGSSEPLNFTVSGNKLTFDERTTVQVGMGIPLAGTVFTKK
ncbi:hypothetical protein [Dysgonomonas termitidis]|uniref:Lipocalin-like domain-containing protein n=1 Tax=Dysgonomonas termitidis TaxID=1516126 RepID=A0ABV9KW69_9BACT